MKFRRNKRISFGIKNGMTCTSTKCRFDNCSRPQRAEFLLDNVPHEDRDTVPFPEVSVLERVECAFLLMTYNTDCRQQYQQNKQTKKTLKRVFEHPTAPNSQASLFRPYESGRSGRLYMASYVNCKGN